MYELVSVFFPFADNIDKAKPRPGFVISRPFGSHKQVIVAYVTTQFYEQLDTDVLLDPSRSTFRQTGLKQKSLLKLHRLVTFQPEAIREGEGALPKESITEVKKKLKKVFQL